jgi:hypothetical protein
MSPIYGCFADLLCLLDHDTCHPLMRTCVIHGLTTCQLLVRSRLANMVGDVSGTSGVQNIWGIVQYRNVQRKMSNVDRRGAKAMW